MGKKEQGYIGVIRDANNEVLGYAMKPEIKKLWEASPDMLLALKEGVAEIEYLNAIEDSNIADTVCTIMKSAIAKANGEQP
jgi:hypothetical protein